MKLTLEYVQNAIRKDKRFSKNAIDILQDGQIAVWLKPEFIWSAKEGNRTVEHSVEYFQIKNGYNPQDTVQDFKNAIMMIEKAI